MKNKKAHRVVAYFDIMGFKDRIYRHGVEGVKDIMKSILDAASIVDESENSLAKEAQNNNDSKGRLVMPVVFSDTILFISANNSLKATLRTILASAYFLKAALENQIPVKGALAYGEFVADFEDDSNKTNLRELYGLPLIDAYNLSNEIYIYGAVLHHTIESFIEEKKNESSAFKDFCDRFIKEADIPMKTTTVKHQFLDWTRFENEKEKISDLISGFYKTSSGAVRKYIDNTTKIYENKFALTPLQQ